MIRIIDGGYLIWIFGSSPERLNSWLQAKQAYLSTNKEVILVMDGGSLYREDFYSEYKQRRKKRREEPERRQLYEQVQDFKRRLLDDPSIRLLTVKGLEADDLIGTISLLVLQERISGGILPETSVREDFQKGIEVIGVDKDLLQLPNVKLCRHGGEDVTLENYRRKLPKIVQRSLESLTPERLLLFLCLFGDRSDSVPRLLPQRIFPPSLLYGDLASCWTESLASFGDSLLRNLYLTVLPGPWVFKQHLEPQEVFSLVVTGKYYEQELSPELEEQILATIKIERYRENAPQEEEDAWERFLAKICEDE